MIFATSFGYMDHMFEVAEEFPEVKFEHCSGFKSLDNMSTYFLKPLQIDSKIEIRPTIIEVSRKFGKIDVEIYHAGALVSKAMLTAQVI